jgi:hypothetical protein
MRGGECIFTPPPSFPSPEGEGKEGKTLLPEREGNNLFLPLQGGGWEGDGDLSSQDCYVFSIIDPIVGRGRKSDDVVIKS